MNYDPFVKEDFILPEKWYVSVTNETVKDINIFKSKTCWKNNAIDYKIIGYEGVGYNSPPNDYIKITFEQFKKYVLKEPIEKWSVGSYVVFLNSEIQSNGFNKGDIQQILEYNSSSIIYYSGVANTVSDNGISEQIKWFATKSEAEKFAKTLINKPKEVIPEYVELLEGFDSTRTGKIFDTKNVIPLMNDWSSSWTWESIFKNDLQKVYFKPSTKKDFDAQNKLKFIEKWSPETYVVCIKEYSTHFKVGDVAQIQDGVYKIHEDCVDISKSVKYPCMPFKDWCKWFAIKSEAEEFAKTLVKPVKKEIKQPLKQAVHCKTQEEWDFVTKKLNRNNEWEEDYPCQILVGTLDWKGSVQFCIAQGIQILSFKEWCDLNGYKMEKEVKFEVGKWYKMNDCWYLRYKGKDIVATDKIYMSECIDSTFNHKYDNGFVAYLREQKTWRLASIEEIQQYLPDGHSDKIKADREFKVGDWVYFMGSGKSIVNTLWQPGKILQIKCIIRDSLTFHGCSNYTEGFRHATPEEINNHLISIEQIPAGEPLNTGIQPNKDGMFKYKSTLPGTSWSGGTIDNHLDAMIPTKTQSEIEFNYLPEPK